MIKKHLKALTSSNEGVTTLEFAIVLPLLFLITFMTILFLFWIGDAMLQAYAGFRINQVQVRNLPISEDSPILDELYIIPTLNQFQYLEYSRRTVELEGQAFLNITDYVFEDSLMPAEWLRLALLPDWQSRDRFERLSGYTLSLQEPFLPFAIGDNDEDD